MAEDKIIRLDNLRAFKEKYDASLQKELEKKQNKLSAGENINIDSTGVISAIAAEQQQADWNQTDSNAADFIKNKPDLEQKQNKLTDTQLAAVNSGITSSLVEKISTNESNVATINSKIPTQASETNQLADKDFVNSSINSIAAYFITKNAAGDSFATKAELSATTTFYSGGSIRVPTRNDYCIVLTDESHDNATTRYIYNNGWEFQYIVNETALTSEQLAALNSGITKDLVTTFSGKQDALDEKQLAAVNSGITSELITTFNNKQDALTTEQLNAVNSGITKDLVVAFGKKQDALNEVQLKAVNSGITSELVDTFNNKQDALDENQLAAVNSGITNEQVIAFSKKQDALSADQLNAVNSGITQDLVNTFSNKQDALNEAQLNAVNSGITSALVNTFSEKQDALTEPQLNAVNSGITSELVNTFNNKQDALSEAQLKAVNSGITEDLVTTFNNKQNALDTNQLAAVNSGITKDLVTTFNGKQNALDETQLKAVNSGITSELVTTFNNKQDALNENQLKAINSGITSELVTTFGNKQDALNNTQLAAVNSGITNELVQKITTNESNISTINNKIPTEATAENKLADKNFVNNLLNKKQDTITEDNKLDYLLIANAPEYSISKDGDTYKLLKDGQQVGVSINIPKDLVVNSGRVETIEGKTYIVLVLNDIQQTEIKIAADKLIDIYKGDDATIVVDENRQISVKPGVFQPVGNYALKSDIPILIYADENDITNIWTMK